MYHPAVTFATPRAQDARTAAHLFHALSDETRLAVLDMLRGGDQCVCDLQSALDAAQSRLSFHLKVLKDAGLVTDRKEGRWSYYALNTERLAEATALLEDLATPTRRGRAVQLHQLERRANGERASNGVSRPARGRAGCCS